MQLAQASEAVRLSGLTPHQLREWCGRRGVLTPDVPPAGRGRHALYSWHTILALRVLNELQQKFAIEVGAWKVSIGHCQLLLKERSFPSLWGTSVVFRNVSEVELTDLSLPIEQPYLAVLLDHHLYVLACEGSGPADLQLPLFAKMERRA